MLQICCAPEQRHVQGPLIREMLKVVQTAGSGW
jgi:hypothetical protein